MIEQEAAIPKANEVFNPDGSMSDSALEEKIRTVGVALAKKLG